MVMKRKIIAMICALSAVLATVAWSEDLTTITLDEALVFSAPDGNAVTVAAGSYFVELADNNDMRLVPPEGDAVLIQATRGQHDLEIDEPVVQMIDDDEIATHVVLVLPGGEFADAMGSRGGVDVLPCDAGSRGGNRGVFGGLHRHEHFLELVVDCPMHNRSRAIAVVPRGSILRKNVDNHRLFGS